MLNRTERRGGYATGRASEYFIEAARSQGQLVFGHKDMATTLKVYKKAS